MTHKLEIQQQFEDTLLTGDTYVLLNGVVLGGIQNLKFEVSAEDVLPKIEITFASKALINKTIAEQVNELSYIPGVKLIITDQQEE